MSYMYIYDLNLHPPKSPGYMHAAMGTNREQCFFLVLFIT